MAAVLLGASTGALVSAEDPRIVRVKAETAEVLQDPQGYVTSELDKGAEVELLRRQSDGWCVVRPPLGSFSWISGHFVKVTSPEGGTGRIAFDGAKVFVGTAFEEERLRWQVKLNSGDTVDIRGTKEVAVDGDDDASEVWYKISPPAGEVRYIHSDDLELEAAADAPTPLVIRPAVANPAIRTVGGEVPLPRSALAPSPGDPAPPSAGWRPAANRFEPRKPGVNTPLYPNLPRAPDGTWRPADPQSTAPLSSLSPPVPGGATPLGNPPPANLGFTERVEWIELELARMAVREPQEWQLAGLRADAQKMADSGASIVERGRARLLLDKIAEFDALKGKYEKSAAQRVLGPAAGGAAIPAGTPPAPGAAPAADAKLPDYAGRGWLMPIWTARPDVPRYALTDQNGEILQLVTPAPGVNLSTYLRKEVGINGRSTYLQELGKQHVVAERVIELERHRRQ